MFDELDSPLLLVRIPEKSGLSFCPLSVRKRCQGYFEIKWDLKYPWCLFISTSEEFKRIKCCRRTLQILEKAGFVFLELEHPRMVALTVDTGCVQELFRIFQVRRQFVEAPVVLAQARPPHLGAVDVRNHDGHELLDRIVVWEVLGLVQVGRAAHLPQPVDHFMQQDLVFLYPWRLLEVGCLWDEPHRRHFLWEPHAGVISYQRITALVVGSSLDLPHIDGTILQLREGNRAGRGVKAFPVVRCRINVREFVPGDYQHCPIVPETEYVVHQCPSRPRPTQ